MSVFTNDPFDMLAKAFENLYPGHSYTAQLVPRIEDESGIEVWGETIYPDGEDAVFINVSAELKISDAIEVFAHELSHAAAPGEDHGVAWKEAFNKLYQEYERLMLVEYELEQTDAPQMGGLSQ